MLAHPAKLPALEAHTLLTPVALEHADSVGTASAKLIEVVLKPTLH